MTGSSLLAVDISGNMATVVQCGVDRGRLNVLDGNCLFFDRWEDLSDIVGPLVGPFTSSETKCIVSLGPEYFFFRSFDLPFTDRKQVSSILAYEIQDSFPLPEQDYVFDYDLYDAGDGKTNVFVAILKKELLVDVLKLFTEYGLDPEIITISGIASVNNPYHLQKDRPSGFVMLDVHIRSAAVYLVHDGTVRLVRSLPFDASNKAGFGLSDNGRDLVVQNRRHVIQAFSELDRKVKSTLTVSGDDDCSSAGFPWYIGGTVGGSSEFRVELLDQLQVNSIEKNDLPRGTINGEEKKTTNIPVGVCDKISLLNGLSTKDLQQFDFRKDDFSYHQRGTKFYWPGRRMMQLCATLVLFILFGLTADYFFLSHKNSQLKEELVYMYKNTVSDSGRVVDPVGQLLAKVNGLQKETSADTSGVTERSVLLLLSDISERITASTEVFFERFIYDKDTIRIKGRTDNFNSVDRIKHYLDKSPYFNKVTILSANVSSGNEGVRFEMKLQM